MNKKNNLSVHPARRRHQPGYPSWQDPSPLGQPYAQPYPFTKKALNWLAASGLCGALFILPERDSAVLPNGQAAMELSPMDTLKNPFPMEMTGLPYRTVSYGTGLPSRFTEEEARAVIDSVFRAAGLNLEEKVIRVADGLVEVDGYDESQKIGYVWLGYGRMGTGTIIYQERIRVGDRSNPLRFPDNYLHAYNYSILKMTEAFSQIKKPTPGQTAFLQKLQSMIDACEPDWEDRYRFLYYEHILQERIENTRLGPVQPLLDYYQSVLATPDSPKRNQKLDMLIDLQNATILKTEWVATALIKASKHRDYQVLFGRLASLQKAYQAFQRTDPEKAKALQDAIIEGKDGWNPANETAARWLDERQIDWDEADALVEKANAKEQFVAVISQMDHRLSYTTTKQGIERQRQAQWDRHQKKNPEADSLEFAKQMEVRDVHFNYGQVKEDVLKSLEKQVHDYILWAKQQRGY